jgi:RNA polymerase sigma factor (TIGR02999 family)
MRQRRKDGYADLTGEFRVPPTASRVKSFISWLLRWAKLQPMEADIVGLVAASDAGDEAAMKQLFATLYAELRRIAQRELARAGGRQVALAPSSLLHQAYVALGTRGNPVPTERARFMAYSAQVMRRLVIDHVRARRAQKRGAGFELVSFDPSRETVKDAAPLPAAEALEQLSVALDRLAHLDRELAEVVDLRFFCGMTFQEISALQGHAERTVTRRWAKARALLRRELHGLQLE